jgi:hypothetical protein
MLEWERYIAEQEEFNEARCRETRIDCGLEPETNVDCESEICHKIGVCPFLKMR